MKSWVYLFVFCAIICIAPSGALPTASNPFQGATLYVNPTYWGEVQSTINGYPSLTSLLLQAQNISTANWLDTTAKIGNISKILTDAENLYISTGIPVVVPFVIYNLPDRDCSAGASNGEILCADANCTAGIEQYETTYIDAIVDVFYDFPSVRIVAIVEPDALPNMATNLAVPKCAQGQIAYFTGISYAISQFSTLSNVWVYLDAAHGGWIGWSSNLAAYVAVVNQTLQLAGGNDLIRGFATNIANYQPLGSINSTADPCGLLAAGNMGYDETHYAYTLDQSLQAAGITGKGYIIDTSRDGVPNARSNCNNWCNIKGAGLGVQSTSNTAASGITIIDAYYWVKTPGESDGTSNPASPRFDPVCNSTDADIPAPEAGVWFPTFFVMLAENSPFLRQISTSTTAAAVSLTSPLMLLACVSIFSILIGLF